MAGNEARPALDDVFLSRVSHVQVPVIFCPRRDEVQLAGKQWHKALKRIYDIDFEIEYIHSAGRRTTQRLGDRLYFSAGLPVGEADLLAPVPHDAVAMTLLKAEGVLASRPDNELFGWRLRPPKERKWKFQMEAISIGVTNAPATSDF